MEFRVLGSVEALHGGVPLALGGPKQRSVLALLVASAGRPVSVGALIEGVYGDDASDGARRTIHTYVSNLRREVGDVITRAGDGYQLDSADVDAARFEALYRAGSTAVADDPARASRQLREALALWRGHAYGDVEGRSRLDAEVSRLEELRLSAIDARIEADLALGLHRDLVGELEALSAEHPLRESFRAHHMLALYRSGRQSEALRAFGRTRTLLAEELGIDPSPTLQEMEEAILTQDPKLDVRIKAVVETRAILAAELDDALAFQSMADRDAALERRDAALVLAASAQSGQMLGVSGSAAYAWFPDVARALTAATTLPLGLVRVAIDHGEVEVGDRGVVGAPVVRALRLAAVAHPGQVLISADAHAHLARQAEGGWVLKTLGRYSIRGLDADAAVFQLIARGLAEEFPELLLDRLPPPMPGTGVSVPGFELRGEMGGGTVGIMHRAYQPSVGREVAVRVIRTELVTDARFIRRFEAETQRIAGIEHPHLVPLLDHWREPTAAYMVYRLMRGGDLRTLMEKAPPSFEEGVDLIEKMGAALHVAHGAGVVHGRVRPENVLFDRDANPHLADVGVAAMFEGLAAFPADAYTAPETIHGHPSVAADVYSLGALTAEILSGHVLPVDRGLPSVGEAVDRVIARATHPDPAVRHPTVLSFLEDLAAAIPTLFPGLPVRSGTVNPYRGLATFREADAAHFFGRSALVESLVEALAERSLMLVVGPSGIGKSSVVWAGLIPALRRGVLPGSDSWLVVDFFPGSRPFEELESALDRVAVTPSGEAVEDLRSGRSSLEAVAARVLPDGAKLLLVIDQFEELWTHLADDAQRRRFLEVLTEVGVDPESTVKVVATLRADFYDRPLQHPSFGEMAALSTLAVPVPTDAELAEIIRRPAAAVNVNITDALVDAMVVDAGKEPGALPLLQYVLTEMFDNRDFDLLDVADYRDAGGLIGSIGRRAEHIYLGFSPDERRFTRDVFVRLVTVDEDSEDTRRRVRRGELELLGGGAALDRILEAFGRHRLLVFDRDAATRGPTVEVAHEALLSQWDRLAGWIDEARHDLLTRRRIEIAAREWAEAGADPSYLLGGARLELAEAWASGSGMHVSVDEAAYLAESRRVADVERTRRRRDRRLVVAGLSAALVIAVGFGAVASVQRAAAEEERSRIRVNELAGLVELTASEDPDLPILLALEAYDTSLALDDDRVPGVVMAALHNSVQRSRLVDVLPVAMVTVAVNPLTGAIFGGTVEDPSRVVGVDPNSLEVIADFDAGAPVGFIDFTSDGSIMAVAFSNPISGALEGLEGASAASLFNAVTFDSIEEIDAPCCGYEVEFGPDDSLLRVDVISGSESFTRVIDLGTGTVFDIAGGISTWMGDTDQLAVVDATNPGIEIVDARTGDIVGTIDTGEFVPQSIAVSSDGTTFVAASRINRQVRAWRAGTDDPLFVRNDPGPLTARFAVDDRSVVILGNAATQYVVEIETGHTLDLAGNIGGSSSAALLGDDRLAVAGSDAVRIWDISRDGVPELGALAFSREVVDFVPSPDGTTAAVSTIGLDGADARRIDLSNGSVLGQTELYNWRLWGWPQMSGDGSVLGALTFDDPARGVLTDLAGDISTVLGECDTPKAISPDGFVAVVSGGTDCPGSAGSRIVTASSGAAVVPLAGGEIASASFGPSASPADGLVATLWASDQLDIIDASTGVPVTSYDAGHLFGLFPFFSRDGRYLTLANMMGVVEVFDVEAIRGGASLDTAKLQTFDGGPDPGQRMAVSAAFAASSHAGTAVKVWDRQRGDLWFEIPTNANNGNVVLFSDDARFLWYEDQVSVMRRLLLVPDELVALARSRASRDFTVAECERFLSDTDCSVYEET